MAAREIWIKRKYKHWNFTQISERENVSDSECGKY